MQPSHTRLGIDYGTATTAAALAFPDGRILPLAVDGERTVPSGVFVPPDGGQPVAGLQALHLALDRPDCYLADPRQHITAAHMEIAGREVDARDLIAATLRHVADEAARIAGGPVTNAAITVPPAWGPRRHGLLRDAAARAGLARVDLAADPVAGAAWLRVTTRLADDACVLVCDAGATAVRVSVVQYDTQMWQVLSTIAAAGSGGRDLDDAIAAHAGDGVAAADPQAWARLCSPTTLGEKREHRMLWEAARQAKHTLWHTPSTVIALPAPHPPVVLDHHQVTALTESVLRGVPAALDEAVAASDVDRASITAAVLTGGAARLPALAQCVAASTGLSPTVPDRPDQVLAEGVLHATDRRPGHPAPPPTPSGDAPATVRLRLRNAGAPVAFLAASLAVLTQALFGADIYPDRPQPEVVTNTAGFGVAALCAVLTALAAAHMVATGSAVADAGPELTAPAWRARLVTRCYAGAAAIGVTVAAIYGLLAGAHFGLTDNPYLRWCLLAAVPVAAVAVANALLATRLPAEALPGWLDRVRQPVIPVVLAAAGVLAMWASLSVSPSILPLGGLLGRLGAAATGVAIALTVTRQPLLRLVVGVVLGLGAAAVFTLTNNPLIETAYIAAVTWWWLVQLVRTARTAVPHALPAIRRWLGIGR